MTDAAIIEAGRNLPALRKDKPNFMLTPEQLEAGSTPCPLCGHLIYTACSGQQSYAFCDGCRHWLQLRGEVFAEVTAADVAQELEPATDSKAVVVEFHRVE